MQHRTTEINNDTYYRMSQSFCMHLGRRVKRDESCKFGVVFGSCVVEVEQSFIVLHYQEKPSEDACERLFDLSIVHKKKSEPIESTDQKDIAYTNVTHRIAYELECALKNLIASSITLSQYREEISRIEKKINLK